MTSNEGRRQAEFTSKRANLILEQLAQRLHELHIHALGQAANVMMRFDRHRRPARERHTLNHVGIERALG
jgi:hypothetical protein